MDSKQFQFQINKCVYLFNVIRSVKINGLCLKILNYYFKYFKFIKKISLNSTVSQIYKTELVFWFEDENRIDAKKTLRCKKIASKTKTEKARAFSGISCDIVFG